MPIIEKVQMAETRYEEQLKQLRNRVLADDRGDDFEKDMIRLLTDMLETRTEITILGRVLAHQREHSAVNP